MAKKFFKGFTLLDFLENTIFLLTGTAEKVEFDGATECVPIEIMNKDIRTLANLYCKHIKVSNLCNILKIGINKTVLANIQDEKLYEELTNLLAKYFVRDMSRFLEIGDDYHKGTKQFELFVTDEGALEMLRNEGFLVPLS